MSDFDFARKSSNLILLYSAKALKADRASASDTQFTGYKGNYCRKSRFIRAWTCSNIRICPSLACHLVQDNGICQCFWQG